MIFLFGAVMGMEKRNNLKRHDVICNHVCLWQKIMTLQCKYLKTSMVAMNLLKVGLTKNQDKKNANKKDRVWLWGLGSN
jgi:hypothetical protein